MFSTRWRLFRLFGIPINVDLSWLIIAALLTWTLANYFALELPGLTPGSYGLMGLVTALAFFLCIVLHEMGHALVARKEGIPIRGITLFLFGGVAEMEQEPPSAGREFAMAIAGPVVSAVLAGICWGLAALGISADWPPEAVAILGYLAWINLVLLVFNLVPAFPLDGGRVLRSILWAAMGQVRRATYWASLAGRVFAWVLIVWGVLLIFAGAFVSGLWLSLIGMFLNSAAQGSYHQILVRQLLRGEPVRRFMNPNPIVVPPAVDLRHWVDDYVYRYHHKMFPVASNGHPEGVISTGALARYPRDEWDNHAVAEAMRRDLEPITVRPDTDALEALERMQRTGSSRLLVMDGGLLVGIVSLKDLLRFLRLKLELEGRDEGESGDVTVWQRSGRTETPVHS
jgi:Zn-dependent protease